MEINLIRRTDGQYRQRGWKDREVGSESETRYAGSENTSAVPTKCPTSTPSNGLTNTLVTLLSPKGCKHRDIKDRTVYAVINMYESEAILIISHSITP